MGFFPLSLLSGPAITEHCHYPPFSSLEINQGVQVLDRYSAKTQAAIISAHFVYVPL
jgi:hypothetical protein